MYRATAADSLVRARRGIAWVRTHRKLLVALGVSATLHMVAAIGTLGWLRVAPQPEAVQFDAVLAPLPDSEPATPAMRVNASLTRPVLNRARPRAPRPLPTPKSDATFVAPENAIAVQRPAAVDETGPGTGGPDTVGGATDAPVDAEVAASSVATQAPGLAAESPPPLAPAAPGPAAAPAMELPQRVSIAYHATTSIADGVAHYTWKRDGEKYVFESTIAASGFFVNMFAGTITQQSTGTVTATGLEPELFTIRRGEGAAETAEFQRATRQVKLSRGGESRQLPLPPNLQDTQSFLFQLAIGAAKLKVPEDRLDFWVTNARGLNRYTFRQGGDSTLETRFGLIETVHLLRETSEPRDSYEVWLSPKHHYLPVKLKFYVDRFPAELIATNITSTP